MILYFTGTGNSAFIAKRIAEKTGDTAVDVFPMIRENDYGKLSSSRPFVVVCPTYGWQIPHVLGNWLKKTRLSGSRKLYFVMTCGDGIGNAGGYAKRFCEKKGMEYMGCGKVVMPENYVAMFPVPDRTEAERIIGKAIPQADQIAEHISSVPCPISVWRTGALCGDQTVPTVWPASAGVRNRPSNTERPVWENPDTNVREPGREIGGRKKIYKKFAGTSCKF